MWASDQNHRKIKEPFWKTCSSLAKCSARQAGLNSAGLLLVFCSEEAVLRENAKGQVSSVSLLSYRENA